MAKSQELIFEGVALYANLPPRPAQKAEKSEDTGHSVMIECSEDRFRKLKKAGIAGGTLLKKFPQDFETKDGVVPTAPENAMGKTFIRVRATKYKETSSKGPITFNDIPVVDTEGYIIEDSIANGSTMKCIVDLDEVDSKYVKAVLKLKAVIVTDLIVYEGGDKGEAALSKLGIEIKKRPSAVKAVDTSAYTPTGSNVDVEEGDDEFLGQQ